MVDEAKLNDFIGKMLGDLGGAASVAMVRMGDALGLYKSSSGSRPDDQQRLSPCAPGCTKDTCANGCRSQAASGYLAYDPAARTFALLPPEQAMVFAVEDSPVYMMGGFDLMAAMLDNQPKVQAAFKTGGGGAWGDQAGCMFCAVARFFRPGYHNNLIPSWLPSLDGVVAKLERGAKVADIGCGHGWSTVLMAKAFPKSQFIGYDFHAGSIEDSRAHAREHGVSANTRFEVAPAKEIPERDFDLVTELRLPARHGRSGRRGGRMSQSPEAGRDLDDRRARGRRPPRGQSQSRRTPVLRGIHRDLRADVAPPRKSVPRWGAQAGQGQGCAK